MQKRMPDIGNEGWRRQKCHACMVLLASDRTPDKRCKAYVSEGRRVRGLCKRVYIEENEDKGAQLAILVNVD